MLPTWLDTSNAGFVLAANVSLLAVMKAFSTFLSKKVSSNFNSLLRK